MNFERLEKNIRDNIAEAQIKIGYSADPMSLNYMLGSLNNLLGSDLDSEGMKSALESFSESVRSKLGTVTFYPIKGGFCLTIPEEGTKHIHEQVPEKCFMRDLVESVRAHADIEEITGVFRSYCPEVVREKMDDDEFDYLMYFPGGEPDEYYYCIALEPEIDGSVHVTYHRFIREDYESIFLK